MKRSTRVALLVVGGLLLVAMPLIFATAWMLGAGLYGDAEVFDRLLYISAGCGIVGMILLTVLFVKTKPPAVAEDDRPR